MDYSKTFKNLKFRMAAVLFKNHFLIAGVKGLKDRCVLSAAAKQNL